MHTTPGRPPLEDTYPLLHDTIVSLATARAGADSGRRTEMLNSCNKTLDDLRAALLKEDLATAMGEGIFKQFR